jgi:hypothetical protein
MEQTCILSRRIRVLATIFSILAVANGSAGAADSSSIATLNTITTISTTIPANGDLNPYGVARVPRTKGSLVEGRFLISNFNNGANQQGTGTTIVQIAPDGISSSAQRPGGGWKSAHDGRRPDDFAGGVPDRPRQQWQGDQDNCRASHQWSVGHDCGGRRQVGRTVCDQCA